jgi:hypothetical protein
MVQKLFELKLLKCSISVAKKYAVTGNRTQGNCLEGNYVTITPLLLHKNRFLKNYKN